METRKKRVAIAGGGFAGAISIVSLIEENIEPVCFEKTDKAGGTWCYREESAIGVPSTMPTTILNHSKEIGAISTYVIDKEITNYMRHDQVYEQFKKFCDERGVWKYMNFNSEVIEVKKAEDYKETGRWFVAVQNTLTGSVSSDIYDGVVISVGQMNIPKWPKYKGLDSFKGKFLHTHSLKGVKTYEDKSVVVVGMGCSGLDAACEISKVAKKVYLSTRSGAHVINRVGPRGYPIDLILFRRYLAMFLDILPINWTSWIIENTLLDPKFNSRLYAVQPQWHIFSKDPVVSDDIASKLLSGLVIQKGDIAEVTKNGVLFEGDSEVTETDAIIMATGYTIKFPFLEKGIFEDGKDGQNLYKCIWPPNLEHHTLAFVGFFLPFGPSFPLGEMQSRYVAQVFAGNCKLPSADIMRRDIEKRNKYNAARYAENEKQSLRVDFVSYMDELAELIDAKPNLLKIFFTDPKLFYKVFFGPCSPYQYRLQGPHPWEGARNAIMTSEERVNYPYVGKSVKKVESGITVFLKKFIIWLLPFA